MIYYSINFCYNETRRTEPCRHLGGTSLKGSFYLNSITIKDNKRHAKAIFKSTSASFEVSRIAITSLSVSRFARSPFRVLYGLVFDQGMTKRGHNVPSFVERSYSASFGVFLICSKSSACTSSFSLM